MIGVLRQHRGWPALKQTTQKYRTDLAALKQRCDALERQVRDLSKSGRASPLSEPNEAAQDAIGATLRFRPEGFAKHRQRLGLSAQEAGVLVGASALSIYKWEKGEARPRASFMPAIAAFRELGKREAAARLAAKA